MEIEKLIKKCLAGNKRAQKELYDLYATKVFGICRRYAYTDYEATDSFQEAFIKIFDNLEKFDPTKGSFDAWIARITINESLLFIRKNKRFEADDIDDQGGIQSTLEHVDESISFDDLLVYIDELPPKQRIIFNMYVIEGYNHQEIADQLMISEGTSKSQLARARAKLMQQITMENERINNNN